MNAKQRRWRRKVIIAIIDRVESALVTVILRNVSKKEQDDCLKAAKKRLKEILKGQEPKKAA
jgi:hypothetical protein